jgi:putative sigma-54 modulation protein
MNVIVSGKNLRITEALREHASEKIEAIQRYFDHIIEADITLSLDKRKTDSQSSRADVTVWANGTILKSTEHREEMFAAINGAIGKIERQLKKYKQKLRELPKRRGALRGEARRAPEPEPVQESVHTLMSLRGGTEGQPRIIRTHNFAMKPMSVDEAAMQLEVLNQEFVVFANAETNEVNVVYKRQDGNIGLIEPGLR